MQTSVGRMKMKSCINKKSFKRYLPLTLMAVPGLCYLLLNNYLPMFGLVIAFKNITNFSNGFIDGFLKSPWIGFKNFEYLYKTSDALIVTRNTLLYNGGFIVINTIAAVAIAIILNEITHFALAKFYQSVVLLPYLISMVIVSYLAFSLFSVETGLINKSILGALGINPISWYSEAKYWPAILTIINLWKNIGFLCVIYYASIIGIDKELYEAATLDGANKWQQIKAITLSSIRPVITTMVLLGIGRIFYSDFGLFYQVPMDSGALYSTTNVIDTYVYRGLLQMGDIGMSSAAGLYQSVVGFVLVLISNYVVNKVDKENSLF